MWCEESVSERRTLLEFLDFNFRVLLRQQQQLRTHKHNHTVNLSNDGEAIWRLATHVACTRPCPPGAAATSAASSRCLDCRAECGWPRARDPSSTIMTSLSAPSPLFRRTKQRKTRNRKNRLCLYTAD